MDGIMGFVCISCDICHGGRRRRAKVYYLELTGSPIRNADGAVIKGAVGDCVIYNVRL